MPTMRHLHTLRKVRGTKGKNAFFMCNHPECTWKSPSYLMEGKKYRCNYCENDFLFNPTMKSMRFPHCPTCTMGRKNKKKAAVEMSADIMADLGLVEEAGE